MNDQDGVEDEDVPAADGGFFVDGEVGDEGNEAKVNQDAAEEEKSKEAHDVKFKASPCRPNSVEVAKHDKTHLPYRNWCPVREDEGEGRPAPAREDGQGRVNRFPGHLHGLRTPGGKGNLADCERRRLWHHDLLRLLDERPWRCMGMPPART